MLFLINDSWAMLLPIPTSIFNQNIDARSSLRGSVVVIIVGSVPCSLLSMSSRGNTSGGPPTLLRGGSFVSSFSPHHDHEPISLCFSETGISTKLGAKNNESGELGLSTTIPNKISISSQIISQPHHVFTMADNQSHHN